MMTSLLTKPKLSNIGLKRIVAKKAKEQHKSHKKGIISNWLLGHLIICRKFTEVFVSLSNYYSSNMLKHYLPEIQSTRTAPQQYLIINSIIIQTIHTNFSTTPSKYNALVLRSLVVYSAFCSHPCTARFCKGPQQSECIRTRRKESNGVCNRHSLCFLFSGLPFPACFLFAFTSAIPHVQWQASRSKEMSLKMPSLS